MWYTSRTDSGDVNAVVRDGPSHPEPSNQELRYVAGFSCQLLDFHDERLPGPGEMQALRDQPKGRHAAGERPAEPWRCVDGQVHHKRGHDFANYGFMVVGHLPGPTEAEQEDLRKSVRSYSGWQFWHEYLRRQDELFGERLATDRE